MMIECYNTTSNTIIIPEAHDGLFIPATTKFFPFLTALRSQLKKTMRLKHSQALFDEEIFTLTRKF